MIDKILPLLHSNKQFVIQILWSLLFHSLIHLKYHSLYNLQMMFVR